ncbi:alpha-xylosidase [Aestuariimicrobium ganziense]|uniref:alpha-xylosidase n=1 Tax=Aestuariimicrobium ganziense TaxID=2773677 RepID=UPI0019436804|nr:alpha-xylosidase [Aestuariimicrobium ganziense]
MKFTDGYWMLADNVKQMLRPAQVESYEVRGRQLVFHAPTGPLRHRGDTLNRPIITVRLDSPAPEVVAVEIEHFHVAREHPAFDLPRGGHGEVVEGEGFVELVTGSLRARVATEGPWSLQFWRDDVLLTESGARSVGAAQLDDGSHHVIEQLSLGIREYVYGLGERFGPFVKNGQSVDIWNADGGTSSEQAYKNVPFQLSSRGYGVLVDSPDRVSYEIASEVASRLQFSVPGQRLRYLVIDGPTPKHVLERYTGLAGRPARVPAWSYGLWLSTSFTTDYDEQTVLSFVDGMAERNLPLSVFHFDCFWMRQFHWSDFTWDPVTFPDPEGLLRKLHDRGLKVSVWINPYIARRSALFDEGVEHGYLVTRADGSVWQWDMWQAGMALVDFTNPDACQWYADKLKGLLDQGVDCFKTDFGERIPTEVVWHDGSDPHRMHNWYAQLYNQVVFDLLERERGEGEAVLFARSATVGGQKLPVHWGGDCESTFAAMAESLRGGLSMASSGFGFWSHDIGGFEGLPDPAIFKRWVAFGLLSSHSRLHGSSSYRVPWAFDDEAVDVTRTFTELKMSLMPYLAAMGEQAHLNGVPVMRPMVVEFPDDPATATLDTQYMLGDSLLVAPVFSADGMVEYYLPEGRWTRLLTGEVVEGGRWLREQHGFDSLPLMVRPGSVLARGSVTDRPDYDWADGVRLEAYQLDEGQSREVLVPRVGADPVRYTVTATAHGVEVEAPDAPQGWSAVVGGRA